MIDYTSVILPALFAAGYWGIGYLESQLGSAAEPFDFKRTVRTLVSGLVIGFIQAFAGLQVDPASVTTLAAFDGVLVIALNKIFNLYSSSSGSAAVAAPVTSSAAAAVQPGSAVAAAPASTTFDLGFSVTPTLLYGLKSPATLTFRMTGSHAVNHPGIASVDISWDDGSSQNVKMVNGYAEVSHTFIFVAQPHYTGISILN